MEHLPIYWGDNTWREPTIFAIRKGAPFLVQTRLQWLALMNPIYGSRPDLIAVQLLGTKDDFVEPGDNVDFVIDHESYRLAYEPTFFFLEVPESDHANVVEMTDGSQQSLTRAAAFRNALMLNRIDLGKIAIPRDNMADNLPDLPDSRPTNVVFVVHGIRDKGFWTQKLAQRIKRFGDNVHGQFESHTQGYGYFAMLPFLLRPVRQRKVEWLMDRYTEERARFPNPGTKFNYIGHSNGTYLIAHALENYPAAKFERIVFAGSVVRRNFNWSNYTSAVDAKIERESRVKQVLNFVATSDWVVALFPKGLQPWRAFDLGSAGYDGFDDASSNKRVAQFEHIKGGHGAALLEENWDALAKFIVSAR